MKKRKKIFLVDDDELILSMLSRVLKKEGYDVISEADTDDIVTKIKASSPDVVVLDIGLPDISGIDILKGIKSNGLNSQVVMLTADDSAETAVKAMKLGAADYLTKPFNMDKIKRVISNAIEKESLKREVAYLRKVCSESEENNLLGESAALIELKGKMEKMAQARVSTILVTGESGTGKEVVARHIHHLMHGNNHGGYTPFVSINCAALPDSILESELFGYEKGSFTDARSDKIGLFEMANGGSILLDEIGDMKPSLQSKLLRVLEERRIRRLGGKNEIPIELLVMATTNRNLAEAVKTGEFRQDLFFRLNTFYMHIIPLRERKEDIPILASHYLSYFASKYNNKKIRMFSPETEKLLISYGWPGNVRELKNLVERFVVLENTEIIEPEQLPSWLIDQSKNSISVNQAPDNGFTLPESGISLESVEKDLIMQALEKSDHNKAEAARLLHLSYDTLRYQLKKFGMT
jgi:DNA-binding NtrC family response regulator